MSFTVRDGKFDVVIAASPRVEPWPSVGVRTLSMLCTEMGLSVGFLGGETLRAKGVIPLPGTGGLVFAEDAQHRIHRIRARSVVRVSAPSFLPDPFPGWLSNGMVPLSTARQLMKDAAISWNPATVILGTGNPALRFASALLEQGVPEVICIETFAQWGAKRFAGWEVERRRFEMLGGRLIEATPLSLSQKGPLLWEFRCEDEQGVRILEAARVVSAGPFGHVPGVREYPPASGLFELEQTAGQTIAENVEGWVLEKERARALAVRIIRALAIDLGSRREELERISRRTRARLQKYGAHLEEPFTPNWQGKWLSSSDARKVRAFTGVPREELLRRPVASIECFEKIGCNLCEQVCPTSAIDFSGKSESILSEVDCTGCGLCLSACPSGATFLIQEKEGQSLSKIVLKWAGERAWKKGETATLVNRRGEGLGTARITDILPASQPRVQLVQVEVPSHLLWEARGLKRSREAVTEVSDPLTRPLDATPALEDKVEVSLEGERRFVRDKSPVSVALFEIGQSRIEDTLLCPDGSCGLCEIMVDGVKKLACEAVVHRGMAIRMMETQPVCREENAVCPCLGITRDDVIARLQQGQLQSPEAAISVTHVGEGKCHGQLCSEPFRRLLMEQGLKSADQWIDWRFPWSEWILIPGSGS